MHLVYPSEFCMLLFLILLGIIVVPGEIENNGQTKFGFFVWLVFLGEETRCIMVYV